MSAIEVMDVSATRTLMHRCWRRRVGRGHTVENGGVYIYDNTREASSCDLQDRTLRPRV